MALNSNIDLIAFGEILWDIIDGCPHLGGAPFNLAAHASLCGLNTAVVSAVGNDKLGAQALARAAELGINTQWVITDVKKPTGTVPVKLINSLPQYTITENVAWDHILLADLAIDEIVAVQPRAFCFGSLAQRSPISAGSLRKLLDKLEETLVFFDVNLRQHYWSKNLIKEGLRKTDWLKVNDEEALLLEWELFESKNGFECFAAKALEDYDLSGVLITCGKHGCMVFEKGREPLRAPGVEVEAIDTVGAGDAFSAAFLTELLKGKTAEKAAKKANWRGAMVASKPGAIPVF